VLRALFWALAVVVPIFVAMSRLYRGMHHATDVLGSVVLGVGSLACAIVVARVSTAATASRSEHVEPVHAPSVVAPEVPV
jgi:undecaprenyl-diphosphatase